MEVISGDTISTNGTGVVQLLFVDETKIALGPNARMVLDVSMLRGKRKAKKFTVQALGGSFRFISGKSRKRAYSIKTPSATMAVRGTTFDMWISTGRQSAMLVLEGTVQMCGRRGWCRSASRQCSMFATSAGGRIGRPADDTQYDKALEGGFPFIRSQQTLLPPFRFTAGSCSERAASVSSIESERPVRPSAEPREVTLTRSERAAGEKGDNPGARAEAGGSSSRSGVSAGGGLNVSADPGGGGSGARATATAGNVTATAGR